MRAQITIGLVLIIVATVVLLVFGGIGIVVSVAPAVLAIIAVGEALLSFGSYVRKAGKSVRDTLEPFLERKHLEKDLENLDDADERVLGLVPSIYVADSRRMYESAEYYVRKEYEQYGKLLKKLNSTKWRRVVFSKTMVRPCLSIYVDEDLRWIEYVPRDDGHSKLRVENPVLLKPCTCTIPPEYQNGYPCPMHSRENGDIVYSLMNTCLYEVHYGGVVVYRKKLPSLWPTSIDTLHFAKVIRDNKVRFHGVRSVLEVGSGTGFLGIYFAKEVNGVRELTFVDLFLTPLYASIFNFYRNHGRKDMSAVAVLSNGLQNVEKGARFDLVICNPPYLPLLGVRSIASLNAVSGTYLLEDVIKNSYRYASKLLFAYSSIATPEVEQATEQLKKHVEGIRTTCLAEHWVPFRVTHAFAKEGYVNRLVEERGEYMRVADASTPFRLWHKIYYVLVNF